MDRASAFNQTSDNKQNDNIPLSFEEDDQHVAQSSASRLLLLRFRIQTFSLDWVGEC